MEKTDVLHGKKAEAEQMCIGNEKLCLWNNEAAWA